MKRNRIIDQAKGIAIILVIIGHIPTKNMPVITWLYSFHIPIFLVVCGYVLADKPPIKNVKSFLKKQSIRLLYPFVTFSIIKALFGLFIMKDIDEFIDPLVRVPLLAGDGALWYLPAFFVALVIFQILRKYHKLNYLWIFVVVTILCSETILLNHPYYERKIWFYLNLINHDLLMCVFIGVGYIFRKKNLVNKNPSYLISFSLLAIGLILSIMNGKIDIHYSNIRNGLLFYPCAVINCLGLMMLLKRMNLHLLGLEYLGKNSLVIFLTHTTLRIVALTSRWMKAIWAEPYFVLTGSVILVLIIEIPIIYLSKRQLSFLFKMPKKARKLL